MTTEIATPAPRGRRLLFPVTRVLAAFLLAAAATSSLPQVTAGITINFGSTVGALNIESDGTPIDRGWQFQLGAFEPGFVPSNANRPEWADHWVPMGGPDGKPVASATAPYDDSLLGFRAGVGIHVNCFSGVTTLTHNRAPFTAGAAAYVLGFDGATAESSSEWLLLSDPAWRWPDAGTFSPPRTFAVTGATIALAGRANDPATGAELVSAPIGSDPAAAVGFGVWSGSMFPAELAEFPDLVDRAADPDGDGVSNLLEFFLGTDPLLAGGRNPVAIAAGGSDGSRLQVSFSRSKSAGGVLGALEQSSDLLEWQAPRVESVAIEDAGTAERITLTVPAGPARASYFRLRVVPE